MAGEVDYQQDIRPLLLQKCSACHGAIKQEAGLRLDAGKLIYSGGDNGPVINLNAPSESMLLERVVSTDADFRMPPQGEGEPLKPGQIELAPALGTLTTKQCPPVPSRIGPIVRPSR